MMRLEHQVNSLATKWLLLTSTLLLCAGAQAGPFPKLMTQVPKELQGEYVLLARVNPDKTLEDFSTNAPLFATILSNRVVMANGTVRPIAGVMRVTQNGTNVYMVTFQGKTSWLMAPTDSPSKLAVLEPDKAKPETAAAIYVLSRKTETASSTNSALPRKEGALQGQRDALPRNQP